MEFIASLVILVPILMPIALQAGIDPVHLGIVMTMNLVIGALTPPLGVLVFATASAIEADRDLMPFTAADVRAALHQIVSCTSTLAIP